jgi:hypothetical protein
VTFRDMKEQMTKRTLLLALLLALCPGFAQVAPAADAPASREDIEKLFTTMRIREMMRSMLDLMSKQSKQMAHDALKKKSPEVTQKDLDRMDAMSDRLLKDMDTNGMIDDMIPVYQRHLNKSDVAAMTAFYQTPTGQKLLREQPQMSAEAMQAVQPRMTKMMGNILDQAEQMAKEIIEESKPASAEKK